MTNEELAALITPEQLREFWSDEARRRQQIEWYGGEDIVGVSGNSQRCPIAALIRYTTGFTGHVSDIIVRADVAGDPFIETPEWAKRFIEKVDHSEHYYVLRWLAEKLLEDVEEEMK